MALTLEDVVMRRTGLGQFGKPAPEVLEKVASQMAAHLGWDEDKKSRRDRQPGPHLQGRGMTAFVVFNPNSANGRTGRTGKPSKRRWKRSFP